MNLNISNPEVEILRVNSLGTSATPAEILGIKEGESVTHSQAQKNIWL